MEKPDDMIDAVLDGKYRIERLLGRGGMGSVYVAHHVQLDRTVAVKVLKLGLVTDNEAAARFAREARASARIQHPNVVRVYDFGSSDGRTYLVMELLEGDSLRALLQSAGALDPRLILEIVRQDFDRRDLGWRGRGRSSAPKSPVGAKEPEPTAQAVGIPMRTDRAPEGRNNTGKRVRSRSIAPTGARTSFFDVPTARAVGSGSFAPSALFGAELLATLRHHSRFRDSSWSTAY